MMKMNRNHYFYNPYDKNKRYRPHNNQKNPSFQQNKALLERKSLNNNYLLPKQTNVLTPCENPPTKAKYWKHKAKTPYSPKSKRQTNVEPHQESNEDAVKAIEMELEFNRLQATQYILRFPDPVIDKSIIQGFSSGIVNVRVQQPITPR